MIICEIYFRLPFLPQQLEYKPDNELGSILKAGQEGYMWMGNMSFKSPAMKINSDGHRGRQTDWTKPTILAVGNSEAFGSGVLDDETWTARTEAYLREEQGWQEIQVVNLAHPGHGPYHHFVRLKRALGKGQNARCVIVRVDVADRYFKSLNVESIAREIRRAEIRQKIRGYTRSLPYLYNKVCAEAANIKTALSRRLSRERKAVASDAKVGCKMWEENLEWWVAIQHLCAREGVPLVFMVYDRDDTASAKVLLNNLRGVTSAGNGSRVFHLEHRYFDQATETKGKQAGKGGDHLTLRRDPHASSLQHQCIAQAVAKFLSSMVYERESGDSTGSELNG
jgi:hypothetical protein